MQLDYVLELPNDLRAIEQSVDYLTDKGLEVGFDYDRLRLNFRVGLTEALANAMLYGNCRDPQKRVRLEAHLSPVRDPQVTDEGRGFDPDAVLDPTLPANRARTGGRGIFLIHQLMDRVEYNERGNSITMILRSREAAAPVPPARHEGRDAGRPQAAALAGGGTAGRVPSVASRGGAAAVAGAGRLEHCLYPADAAGAGPGAGAVRTRWSCATGRRSRWSCAAS
jgi:serine/threonine-protein kinase RsbW